MYRKSSVSPLLAAMVLLIIAVFSVGCTELRSFPSEELADSASEQQQVTVYYITRRGNYLVPINASVPKNDNLHCSVVKKVLSGPQDPELKGALSSPFPPDVLLKYIYAKDGWVGVDLAGETIKTMDPELLQRALSCLMFTLAELPDMHVDSIEMLIDGASDNGMLLTHPIHINPIYDQHDDGFPVTVFFSYDDTCLVPVTIKLVPETTDVLKETLDRLVAGPRGIQYLSSVFPEGTRLLEYELNEGLINLNFSKEAVLLDRKGNISKEEQSPSIGSLALTLRQFSGIERFQILIEGKPLIYKSLKVPRNYLDLENIAKAQPEQG